MRPKDFVNLVPGGHVNFQVELRSLVAELFPGVADQPGLLLGALVRGMAQDDRAGLQRSCRAQDTIREIVCRDDRQADGFTAFFRERERLRKELLLDAAEQLFGFKFVFARGRAAQQAYVKHDDIAAAGFDAIEHIAQVIEGVNVADGHEDVAWPRTYGLGRQFAFHFQMELVHLNVFGVATGVMGDFFRNREDDEEHDGKGNAGDGRVFLREEVYDGDAEQGQGDQTEAERDFHAKNRKVERHAVLAIARMRVSQDEYRQALHREAPDHPEGIEVREKRYIAPADNDGDDLQQRDNVDDAVGCAEPAVWLTEPVGKNAVFGNSVEHPVGTYDRGIYSARENQRAHHDNEAVEEESYQERPLKIHGQAADQIFQIALANTVRDDHHREKRDQRSKDQTVNENDQAGLFQIRKFGMLDFAVDLRERLFAAHGEDRMAKSNEDGDDSGEMSEMHSVEPAHGVWPELQVFRIGKRRERGMPEPDRVDAPADQDHNHHGRDLHDAHSLLAGFGDALNVVPPEISGDEDGEESGAGSGCDLQIQVNVGESLV